MSIAQMLRQHGYNATRSIASDGRVIFPGATNSGSLPSVQLKAHTFHGGDAPAEDAEPQLTALPWWKEDDRLAKEQAAVATCFPQFSMLDDEPDLAPAWFGNLDTGHTKFNVLVSHRYDHGLPIAIPGRAIGARMVNRRRVSVPHLYLNGKLCIASDGDWNPEEDTIATAIAWTAHWLGCYVEWYFTGTWPYDSYQPHAA